jgi:hypothetical protein
LPVHIPPEAPRRRWHGNSLYGLGPRCPRDRNERARIRYLLDQHFRAGRLPAVQEKVGNALLRRLGTDGQCDPTYDTLGADAGCSGRTARRATARMRELGLVDWQCRLVRTEDGARQTSNQYVLFTSAEPGGQAVRETRKYISSPLSSPRIEAEPAALEVRQANQQVLNEVAKRRMKALGLA